MRSLDFTVIGAQKSGTTTIFEHLRHHPSVYLPPGKEAPFFTRPDLYSQGPERLLDLYFSKAPPGVKLGKVTPDYMADMAVPERLAVAFPRVRLIAILRDPVERAYSEYSMQVRRRIESRSFDVAIRELLNPDALMRNQRAPDERSGYVVRGEYGRILGQYADCFPMDQILVLYSADLATRPREVVEKIHHHLGVDHIEPPGLGSRFFEGGSQERVPGLVARARKSSSLTHLWHLLPLRTRDLLFHRLEVWNTSQRRKLNQTSIDPSVESALTEHFQGDGLRLTRLLGAAPPWL